MTQAFRYPSSTNILPVASQYIVSYIRRMDKFKMNRYVQLVEAPAPTFWYFELDPDQSIRVRTPAKHLWADGAKRPMRNDNQFGFRMIQATCKRYDTGSTVGNMALSVAEKQWKIKQVYLEGIASQAMTLRTSVLWQGIGTPGTSTGDWGGLDNSSTWPSSNVADANTLNGNAGSWANASSDEADSHFMAIRKSLINAAKQIFLLTNGVVMWSDLRLVISPTLAQIMGNTGEIRDYYKYGPFAKEAVESAMSPNMNEQYGLPAKLYGIEIVVEDAAIIQDTPSAAQTGYDGNRVFIKQDSNAVLLSRQGAIDAQVGPTFSTCQVYWYEYQMAAQQFVDPIDETTSFHMKDMMEPVLTGGRAGFDITNCI